MSSFFNFNLGGRTPNKFKQKHFLFSILWLLIISTLIFRIDVYAINSLNPDFRWIVGLFPVILIALIIIIVFSQKWYYSLAAIFYPILIVFWFLPKNILDKGKVYLFSHYVDYIFTRCSNFKRTIIHYSLFCIVLMLLILTNDLLIKGFAILIISYFYLRFVYGYIKSSFQPAQMFGSSLETLLQEYLDGGESSNKKFIESITKEVKSDKNLSEEERKKKKLRDLIMWNFGLNYLSRNLNSFKGKKAYVLSWGLQLIFFLIISILYFTFLNYQLFQINPSSYIIQNQPNIFDFFYYTLKSITFNGIDNIKPNDMISKIIEITSYFVIGIFVLIIFASIIFSLSQAKIKENVILANKICQIQNQYLIHHIQNEFGMTIQSALKEFSDIQRAVNNLKKIIDKIL